MAELIREFLKLRFVACNTCASVVHNFEPFLQEFVFLPINKCCYLSFHCVGNSIKQTTISKASAYKSKEKLIFP